MTLLLDAIKRDGVPVVGITKERTLRRIAPPPPETKEREKLKNERERDRPGGGAGGPRAGAHVESDSGVPPQPRRGRHHLGLPGLQYTHPAPPPSPRLFAAGELTGAANGGTTQKRRRTRGEPCGG